MSTQIVLSSSLCICCFAIGQPPAKADQPCPGGKLDSTNLIINGSFEEGPAICDACCVNPALSLGNTDIAGWTVTRATIDYCANSVFDAPDGERSLDLDGFNEDRGGIAQVITTIPGKYYAVEFELAGSIGPPTIKKLRVEAAGQSAGFMFDTTGRSMPSDMGWVRHAWILGQLRRKQR